MPNVDTVSLKQQQQQQHRVKSEEEKSTDKEQQSTNRQSLSLSFIMPVKAVDQTMSTVSLSMEDYDEGKDDYDVEERMVLAAMPPSRFVWKDDCEPPSPIRKLTTQHAPDRVVVLNTRHSLLGEETDTDGEDDDDDEEAETAEHQEDDEQDYNDHLTKLNFRLEMEEHAREASQVLLIPEMPGTDAAAIEVAPNSPMKISPSKSDKEESPEPVMTVSTQQVSILESMTVGFVDTLCLPRKVCGTQNPTLPTSTTTANATPVEYENSLQQGFLQVLSCSNPPDDDEITQLWDVDMGTALQLSCSLPTESPRRLTYPPIPERPTGPHRPGPRERVMRLRKWRRERSLGVPDFPDRTYSMDIGPINEAWRQQPENDQEDLTYDSDPEMSVSMRGKKTCQKKTSQTPSTPKRRSSTFRWMVRESMNQKWDLKWHTEKSSKPVRAWMERGSIVGGQMLEPALVLRHGNECTQLRFLNICRILPATSGEQIRAGILARPSCTLRIMTSSSEEFFLEAASSSKRNEIVDTWKLCVARFATLAVLEDVDGIQREFFHQGCHSYVPDVEEVMDDLERDAKLDD